MATILHCQMGGMAVGLAGCWVGFEERCRNELLTLPGSSLERPKCGPSAMLKRFHMMGDLKPQAVSITGDRFNGWRSRGGQAGEDYVGLWQRRCLAVALFCRGAWSYLFLSFHLSPYCLSLYCADAYAYPSKLWQASSTSALMHSSSHWPVILNAWKFAVY